MHSFLCHLSLPKFYPVLPVSVSIALTHPLSQNYFSFSVVHRLPSLNHNFWRSSWFYRQFYLGIPSTPLLQWLMHSMGSNICDDLTWSRNLIPVLTTQSLQTVWKNQAILWIHDITHETNSLEASPVFREPFGHLEHPWQKVGAK